MDNVIVAPARAVLDRRVFANIARTAIGAVVDVQEGSRPEFIVNPAALVHPRTKAWLKA